MGRVTRGVKAITLRGGDYIVGMCLATEDTQLLAVTELGYGKRTDLSEYRVQTRGGVGVKTYKCSEITGNVVSVTTVKDDEDIMIITSEGVIIRTPASGISSIGRSTKGVRLMRLNDGVKVVSIGITEHEEELPDEEISAEGAETATPAAEEE